MKIVDIIFALVIGRVVGFVVSDFLRGFGVAITFYQNIIIWLVFPLLSLVCLWLASLIGKKILFVFQAAKFFLVGTFATVVDLKLFELLFWVAPISLLVKSISFILSTSLKYWGNKYWAFQKHEKENAPKEIAQFFLITLFSLIIDVSVFYYATKIAGPQFGVPEALWTKSSVILAALAAAVFNFLGYKFLVFKK